MAALMCTDVRVYTPPMFFCMHTHCLCLNKCSYTCTHCAHTHTCFAFKKKKKYFLKVLFLWILSFPIGYTSLQATRGRHRHSCLQGLHSNNTFRVSGGLLKLSCQHMLLTLDYFYPLICSSGSSRLTCVIKELKKLGLMILKYNQIW